jgi:lysophospholipase L1-like esterase
MAKNVSGIWDTHVTAFPGINISRLSYRISQGHVDLRSDYILLHVGTNDVTGSHTVDEILSSFNDLISNVRQHSSGNIIVSAIIPRPIDFEVTGNRVNNSKF